MSAPVVVLGVPAPGAFRLAAMLGRHPRAFALPELGLGLAGSIDEVLEMEAVADAGVTDGLLRAVAALFCAGQTDAGIGEAWDWLRRRGDWPPVILAQALAERVAPRCPVFAETAAGWRPVWLDRVVDGLQDAYFIHLVRHPQAQCAALFQRLRFDAYVPPDYKDFGAADWPRIDPQLAWVRINGNIDAVLAGLPSGRWSRVREEDLHAQPQRLLADLGGRLDLEPSVDALVSMLAPERGRFSGPGPAAAPGGGDADFLRDPTFHERPWPRLSLTAPISWRSDRAGLAGETISLATRFGYR